MAKTSGLSQTVARARRERDALRAEIQPTLDRIRTLSRLISAGGRILDPQPRRTHADHLLEILAAQGQPMRPCELLNALNARGVRVGGRDRRAQLTSLNITLGRCPELRRVDYGLWDLAAKKKTRERRAA